MTNTEVTVNLIVPSNDTMKIPIEILKESNFIFNMLDEDDEDNYDDINFSNNEIFIKNNITENIINHWIILSSLINNKEIKIPKPLKSHRLNNYIEQGAFDYLNNLNLESLKKLAILSDFLHIQYLLDVVCAFIADKFIRHKSVEELKLFNLIP